MIEEHNMDKEFLELWGNFFLLAAKGQKRLEDVNQWMKQGLNGFEDMAAMFKKSYGLDGLADDGSDDSRTFKKAADDFRKSFNDYLNLMNLVPENEHQALIRKNEARKKKVADQAETIDHLRHLLKERGTDQGQMLKGLENLVHQQNEQFQKLMGGFTPLFEEKPLPEKKK